MQVEAPSSKTGALALAITGASGGAYALRLLECLVGTGRQLYLMISKPGQMVLAMESELTLPSRPADMQAQLSERFDAAPGQIRVFGREQWTAPVASGTAVPDAMVVCPCTTGTLAAIATGASRNLIERAADVVLKERRRLILVPRETPFSVIHLENMLKLARMGVVVLPPNPGFYHQPKDIRDLVDFVVARILDHLEIEHNLVSRWGKSFE